MITLDDLHESDDWLGGQDLAESRRSVGVGDDRPLASVMTVRVTAAIAERTEPTVTTGTTGGVDAIR